MAGSILLVTYRLDVVDVYYG